MSTTSENPILDVLRLLGSSTPRLSPTRLKKDNFFNYTLTSVLTHSKSQIILDWCTEKMGNLFWAKRPQNNFPFFLCGSNDAALCAVLFSYHPAAQRSLLIISQGTILQQLVFNELVVLLEKFVTQETPTCSFAPSESFSSLIALVFHRIIQDVERI